MTRFVPSLTAMLMLAGLSQTLACKSVTMVSAESPIQIVAKPPAPPLPDLPAVPQPPPPPRVTLEGDVLTLDEPLTFDATDKLLADHADIVAELAKWLATHPEVVELSVEVQTVGKGSKRTLEKQSKALATQIVDALVAEGIDATRLLAVGQGKSPDEQRHVVLRISKRAEPAATEGAQP